MIGILIVTKGWAYGRVLDGRNALFHSAFVERKQDRRRLTMDDMDVAETALFVIVVGECGRYQHK